MELSQSGDDGASVAIVSIRKLVADMLDALLERFLAGQKFNASV